MARIVLGLGTSHSPQLSLPAEHWLQRGEEDQRNQSLYTVPDGKHVTYEELLAEVDPRVAQEIKPEVFQKRYAANQQGIAKVVAALERSAPTCWSCSVMTNRRPSTTITCRRSVSTGVSRCPMCRVSVPVGRRPSRPGPTPRSPGCIPAIQS